MVWELTKIKNIADVKGGKRLPKGMVVQDEPTNHPYLRVVDFNDRGVEVASVKFITEEAHQKVSRYIISDDDVYISIAGTIGRVGIVPKSLINANLTENAAKICAINKDMDKRFLMYYLRSGEGQSKISAQIVGTSQPKLALFRIKDIEIPKPPIAIQNSISDILTTYDGLIENNNCRIAILGEMSQSLYREWFVKFRFPGHEKNKFIDSPLGKIPKGWGVARLDDFVVLQRGFDLPKKKRNEEGGVPVYAASGINGFHDEVKVKGPGLVTGRSGTLGIVMLVLENFWPLNTSLWVKEFKNCSAFYGYYLLSGIGLEGYNSGAAVPTLNRNYVHGVPVISPPSHLIDEFEQYTVSNHREINILKKKNEVLKLQRNLLLPKLISGNIEV